MCGIENERVLDIECAIGFPLPVLKLQDYVGESKKRAKKRRRKERLEAEANGENATQEQGEEGSEEEKGEEEDDAREVEEEEEEEKSVTAPPPPKKAAKLAPTVAPTKKRKGTDGKQGSEKKTEAAPIWVSTEPTRSKNRANKRRKERKLKARIATQNSG